MTRKLEDLFDLAPSTADAAVPVLPAESDKLIELSNTIDKIDSALPAVRGLEATDSEMDDLASKAASSYQELMDLGMQVDSRFAAEIFSVASNMLGHAITAKTAKLDKKLKMIDLQLKKMRLDQQQSPDDAPTQTAQGMVLNRNELLDRLLKSKDAAKE